MSLLYRVTKIKLERRMIDKVAKIYGPYLPVKTEVVYRTHKNAVTLAKAAAASGNAAADRYDRDHPDHPHGYHTRYDVKVEVCETPDFIPYDQVEGKTVKETQANIKKLKLNTPSKYWALKAHN